MAIRAIDYSTIVMSSRARELLDRHLDDDERVIWSGRPSLLSVMGPYLAVCLALGLWLGTALGRTGWATHPVTIAIDGLLLLAPLIAASKYADHLIILTDRKLLRLYPRLRSRKMRIAIFTPDEVADRQVVRNEKGGGTVRLPIHLAMLKDESMNRAVFTFKNIDFIDRLLSTIASRPLDPPDVPVSEISDDQTPQAAPPSSEPPEALRRQLTPGEELYWHGQTRQSARPPFGWSIPIVLMVVSLPTLGLAWLGRNYGDPAFFNSAILISFLLWLSVALAAAFLLLQKNKHGPTCAVTERRCLQIIRGPFGRIWCNSMPGRDIVLVDEAAGLDGMTYVLARPAGCARSMIFIDVDDGGAVANGIRRLAARQRRLRDDAREMLAERTVSPRMPQGLTEENARQLKEKLAPDETILWCGQPDVRRALRPWQGFMIFALVAMATLFGLWDDTQEQGGKILLGVIFAALACLAPLLLTWVKKHYISTRFLITTRRFITLWGAGMKTLSFRTQDARDVHHLLLEVSGATRGALRSLDGKKYINSFAFYCLDHVAEALATAERVILADLGHDAATCGKAHP